ncbi:MAG: hypothetical protein LBN98_05415 [Prevotellaceae bacterium]|nr:hypothetical protein [Prevotellaceae bacterium]
MKKHLTITTALRIAAIGLCSLLYSGALSAQVSVSNVSTDYAAKQISFTVSWTAAPYNNQIWVIVDYIKVENVATVGGWSRAEVTSVSATGNGAAATVPGNLGFWLNTSSASGSANITVTLSLAAGVTQFNWCAYALDKPPVAELKTAGGYNLKGTPPFTVNGTQLGATITTFGAGTCITSLSDATNNPTAILPALPALSSSNSPSRCGAGAVTLSVTASGGTTTAMTYTWNIGGTIYTTTTNSYTTGSLSASKSYSVTATNANGCTSAARTGAITIHAAPQATISGNASNTCPATTVTLTATASGATTYTWYKNGTQVKTGTSTTYSATATGNYTVKGSNANCTGATSTAKSVTINLCGDVPGCTDIKLYQKTAAYDGQDTWDNAVSYCNSRGARLPSSSEAYCMCDNRSTMAGGAVSGGMYWIAEAATVNDGRIRTFSGQCLGNLKPKNETAYFRCVK